MKDGAPASAFLVVENEFKPATWHLQVRGPDGKPDHRLMGAAHAALHSGFRGNKYEGPNKAQAISELRKLYEQEKMPWPSGKSFQGYKDSNGNYRWVLISSSAFMDQDGEIITAKALEDDVDRCDMKGDYGPLRWWHMGGWEAPDGLEKWETWKAGPGIDLGTCDFNMLHGKLLIESGTFRDKIIGEAFSDPKLMERLEVSIGFSHPPTEPGDKKEFKNIHRFERSLLPAGMASNLLTKYYVTKGEPTMKAQEKLAALVAILRDKPDLAQQILSDAEGVQKAAEAAGLTSKEVSDMISESAPQTEPTEEVIESSLAEPVAEAPASDPVAEIQAETPTPEVEPVEAKAAPAAPVEPAEPADIGDWTPEQLMQFIMEVMKKAPVQAKEIDPALAEIKEALDGVSEKLTAITGELETQKQSLDDLTDSRPVGIKQMQARRPSEQASNIIKTAPAGPQVDPNFMKFVTGGK